MHRPGLTQIGLYGRRRRIKALNFRFKKKRDYNIRVAAVQICIFVFA